ncbi:similar to hypothetical protein KAFR_0B01590 [Kazachstania africana CBS 2517] [Maudiozyma barnettii]|uniref:Uncharacterized protein n=1 Tax=Maudiozyma barnettii TaxID=61262 RepID=A0A8H2VIJ9_9SACH|nr:similar to hypothetical protein KAFR_0B01590 [Kazachstania africana CBS 2517] [Kazachstania barnettii]CAB4256205.1 similar to hypothetical protein KAFR_0B01590 [Kazachstania africana CBS 2517] [Kazachstania barnettii]CAD1784813.1 similar to hypothetical protein KAFR_0B01590 [Kazachstania africana CBS 2517] [Kazachstania barnettii]
MPSKFEFNNVKPFTPRNYRQILESCPNTNWVSPDKYPNHQKHIIQSKSSPPRNLNNIQNCEECNANLFGFHQNVFSKSQKYGDANNKTQNISNSQNMFGSNTYLANTDNMIPSYNNFIGYPIQSNGMMGMTSGGLFYNNNLINSNDYHLQKDYHPQYNVRNNIHNITNSNQVPNTSLNNVYVGAEDILTTNSGTFPNDFDPRGTKDMPAKEKVTHWIDNIPIYEVNDNIWNNDCYPNDYSLNWDETEFDKRNNQFLTRDQTVSLTNSDELIFLQSKKIDCLVRLVYSMEKEESKSKNTLSSAKNDTILFYQEKHDSEEREFENNFEIGFP